VPQNREVQRAVIGVANLYRKPKPPTPAEVAAARAELATAKISAYIKRIVDEAPPLTAEQRERLVGLLGGAPTDA